MSSPPPEPTPAPSLLKRLTGAVRGLCGLLLGLFVVWQLVFLVSFNLLEMIEEARTHVPTEAEDVVDAVLPGWRQGEGPVYHGLNGTMKFEQAWSQLTMQSQGWSLFAPNVQNDIPFPAVELRWDEPPELRPRTPAALLLPGADVLTRLGLAPLWPRPDETLARAPQWLLSDNEPADRNRFFRWGHFRLRRFEGNLGVNMNRYGNETEAEARQRWRKNIEKELREDWDATRAYLKWRLADYRRTHPDEPEPKQVILHIRRFHIPPPDGDGAWDWTGPFTAPFARWLPGQEAPPGHLPVQMYDPVARRFAWLERG